MDDIKAIRDARDLIERTDEAQTLEYDATDEWISAAADAMARLLDALEAATRDAERWRWLAENGSIGFEGAPGWRTVVHFDTFDMAANTLGAAIDAAMAASAPESPPAAQSTA